MQAVLVSDAIQLYHAAACDVQKPCNRTNHCRSGDQFAASGGAKTVHAILKFLLLSGGGVEQTDARYGQDAGEHGSRNTQRARLAGEMGVLVGSQLLLAHVISFSFTPRHST